MLEVTIVVVVLSIGLGGFVRVLFSSAAASDRQFQASVAREGALAMIEELRSTPFDEVFARYNASTADDPAAGLSPGANFPVAGLTALDSDADGFVGEIMFPTPDGVQVREDLDQRLLGMPRDLNGDGLTDAADHSADYQIMPVVVRVRWRGGRTDSVVQVTTLLGDF